MKGEKKSHKGLIWALFIIIVMVFSTIGFFWQGSQSDQNTVVYNGFTFYRGQGGWFTRINNKAYTFQYLPDDLKNLSFSGKLGISDRVYMIYDPAQTDLNTMYVFSRIGQTLTDKGIRGVPACIQPENCPDIPIVKCNETDSAIFFKKGNETRSYKDGGCLVVELKDVQDVSRATERLIYELMGVIK